MIAVLLNVQVLIENLVSFYMTTAAPLDVWM